MEERQSRLSSMVWRRLRPYFCVRLILLNSMFSNFCHVLKKRYNSSAYATLTLREEYLPWRIRIASTPFEVRPLSVSLAMNTIFSSDFWTSEPDRYPNGYYAFSSRVRFHLGIGSRLTFRIPERRRYVVKHISLYYVVSVCDLYLRQKIVDSAVPTGDIFTIGIGAILTI